MSPHNIPIAEYGLYANTKYWASLYGYDLNKILDVSNKDQSGSLSSAADHFLPAYKIPSPETAREVARPPIAINATDQGRAPLPERQQTMHWRIGLHVLRLELV